MATLDPRVDSYIAAAADFARPILVHLREVVHAACPEAEESLKWRMPFFSYRGKPLCMMAAFKHHCGFGFWLSRKLDGDTADDGMGQFGKLTSVKELPSRRELTATIRKAMALNEVGVTLARVRADARAPAVLPEDLAARLAQRQHAAARKTYQGFSPSAQRAYVDWINDAKTDATRNKRIATTLEWLAEGKPRNWKYRK